jgi:hypothetical protein
MEEYSYFDEDPKKGWGFVFGICSLDVVYGNGIGIDLDEYLAA